MANPTTKVYHKFGYSYVPYYVDGDVKDFDKYWDKWIAQHGMDFDLKKNNVYCGEDLELMLKVAYWVYKQERDILEYERLRERALADGYEDGDGGDSGDSGVVVDDGDDDDDYDDWTCPDDESDDDDYSIDLSDYEFY